MSKVELFDEEGHSRGYYSDQNTLNDLTGKEWLFWTRSVISKPYPPNLCHQLRSQHGGQKPPELCRDIINIFTKHGQHVLDPFMGVGGTLLGASLSGRKATGIDCEKKWIDIYKEVAATEKLPCQETILGKAEDVLPQLEDRIYDFIFTDVPYFIMDKAPRSRGKYKKTGEPSRPKPQTKLKAFNDLGYKDKADWLNQMEMIFKRALPLLKAGGYCAVFIGDMYYDGAYHCLSAELAARLAQLPGLVWKANLIWYDVSKKLHIYGYQYSYIPSIIHQNIIVFRKEA